MWLECWESEPGAISPISANKGRWKTDSVMWAVIQLTTPVDDTPIKMLDTEAGDPSWLVTHPHVPGGWTHPEDTGSFALGTLPRLHHVCFFS